MPLHTGVVNLLSVKSIRVNSSINHRNQFSHLAVRQPPRESFDKILLLDHRDEMSLLERRLRQTGFARFHALGGRSFAPVAAKGHSKDRTDAFTDVSLVQRHDDNRVPLASGMGVPDLSAPG